MFSRSFLAKHVYGMGLLLWMGVIFGLSSIQGSGSLYPSPLWYVLERKSAHVFEFCVLAVLAALFFAEHAFLRSRERQTFFIVVLFCTTYAFSDEIHQFFVFGREARFTDVLIDTGGAIFGATLFHLCRGKEIRSYRASLCRFLQKKTSR